MSDETTPISVLPPEDHRDSWIPTWPMIAMKSLEIRRRHGLMTVLLVLILGVPVLVLALRYGFHLFDPKHYGPAGSPSTFKGLVEVMAEFGFIAAAAVGAAAGSADYSEGMFRHLVITGRSRIALYVARIPAVLSMVLAVTAVAFLLVCLVTDFAGQAQPRDLHVNNVAIPEFLDESQLRSWLVSHPTAAEELLGSGGGPVKVSIGPGGQIRPVRPSLAHVERDEKEHMGQLYADYNSLEVSTLNPPDNEMAKIGLWLSLQVSLGFLVGLGLGSLMGQRTVPTVLLIVLQIIITPIMSSRVIPYFIDGQRLIVGVAMNQLRPAWLPGVSGGGPGGGAGLSIPPMPTWAMTVVIVGWLAVSTTLGAWKMATRDA